MSYEWKPLDDWTGHITRVVWVEDFEWYDGPLFSECLLEGRNCSWRTWGIPTEDVDDTTVKWLFLEVPPANEDLLQKIGQKITQAQDSGFDSIPYSMLIFSAALLTSQVSAWLLDVDVSDGTVNKVVTVPTRRAAEIVLGA